MSLPLDDRNSPTNEFVGPLHVDAEQDAEGRIQFDLQHACISLRTQIFIKRRYHVYSYTDLICQI